MVFPAPVCPTSAIVWPGEAVNDTSRSTQGPIRAVAEPDPLEAHLAPDRLRAACTGLAGSGTAHRLVEQGEHPLRRGHGALQEVELLREVLQRLEEAAGELDERREHADGQRAVEGPEPAVLQQQRHRHRGEHLHHREEHRVDRDRPQVGIQVLPVELRRTGAAESASRPKSWTTRMPDSRSWRKLLSRASRTRMSRNASRTRRRKIER